MTLIYLGTSWFLGIFLAHRLAPPIQILGLVAILPLAGVILWWRDRPVRLLSACGLALILGALRLIAVVPQFDEGSLASFNDTGVVTVRGVVSAEPDVRDRYTNLRLDVSQLKAGEDWIEVRGTALVRASRYPAYAYGDELEIQGFLETPPVFDTFSYQDYLAREGVYSMIRRPRITRLDQGRGNPFYTAVFAFKARAHRVINRILPEPYASLLSGILLGLEKGIPADVQEAFRRTGTTHVIAISGFNITIIAGIFHALAERLAGKRRSWLIVLAGIAVYTLLVGADAAVVRAAIMGSLYVIALHYGRQTEALTSLVASGVLMTLHQPLTLWDIGFQLSFSATLGLILVVPPLQARFEGLLARFLPGETARRVMLLLNEALIITLAAQLTTLPVILANFGQLSIVSLLTNFFILPAQPGVMIWGGVATLLGLVILPLGQLIGWVAWLFLAYTVWVVELTARIPYAAVDLGRVPVALVVGYYALLFGVLLLRGERRSKLRPVASRLVRSLPANVAVAGLAVGAVLVWGGALATPDGRLHVAILDIGQGDSIFITGPEGRQILVDGGPDPSVTLGQLGHQMPFWDRTIDIVVLSSSDSDHLGGLVSVVERYQVSQVLQGEFAEQTATYRQWQEALQAKGIPVTVAERGQRVALGRGALLEVLHPGPEPMTGTGSDDNNNSVVLRLRWGRACFLLTGDIEEEAERLLVSSYPDLTCAVLKVGHHGSKTSTTRTFLEAVRPGLAVMSVGADNRYGHPAPVVVERLGEFGAQVLRTDERGTVEITTDGESYWIRMGR